MNKRKGQITAHRMGTEKREQAAQLTALHKASIFVKVIRIEEVGREPILERGENQIKRDGVTVQG